MSQTTTDEQLLKTVGQARKLGRRGAARALRVSYQTVCARITRAAKRGLVNADEIASIRTQANGPPSSAKKTEPTYRKRVLPNGSDSEMLQHLWRNYIEGGRSNIDIRNELIMAYLPQLEQLARSLVRGCYNRDEIVSDLVAVGVEGIISTAARYEPDRCAFWSFASRRCWGRMMDHFRELDHLQRGQRKAVQDRDAATARLLQELGRLPTDDEVREHLGWGDREWRLSEGNAEFSGDAEIGDTGDTLLKQVEQELEPDPSIRQGEAFRELCRGLSLDQQTILHLHYGHDATMKAIGQAMSLSESRISQLVTEAKASLRSAARR